MESGVASSIFALVAPLTQGGQFNASPSDKPLTQFSDIYSAFSVSPIQTLESFSEFSFGNEQHSETFVFWSESSPKDLLEPSFFNSDLFKGLAIKDQFITEAPDQSLKKLPTPESLAEQNTVAIVSPVIGKLDDVSEPSGFTSRPLERMVVPEVSSPKRSGFLNNTYEASLTRRAAPQMQEYALVSNTEKVLHNNSAVESASLIPAMNELPETVVKQIHKLPEETFRQVTQQQTHDSSHSIQALNHSASTTETVNAKPTPAPLIPERAVFVQESVIPQRLGTELIQMIKRGDSTLEVRLDPPGLGHLTLSLKVDAETLTLQVNASSQPVRELLLNSVDRLRQTLSEQGLALADMSVDVRSDTNSRKNNSPEVLTVL